MTRREGWEEQGVKVAPPIHTFRESNPIDCARITALSEFEITPSLQSSITGFIGASEEGISGFKSIINHVSFFYGLYLRTLSNHSTYLRAVTSSEGKKEEIESQFSDYENLNLENYILEGEDKHGFTPKIGNFSMHGGAQFDHKELGAGVGKDVSIEHYHEEYKKFVDKFHESSGIEQKSDVKSHLRARGFGELQVWLCWRYFTGRSLQLSTWGNDLAQMVAWGKQRTGEDTIQWGTRVWGTAGGDYTVYQSFSTTKFPAPVNERACAFGLGCPQNLPLDEAKFANRLSWEKEHSRPQNWGGSDDDFQVMCTHHNRFKRDQFLFDTQTFARIFTIHQPINPE